PGCGPAQGGGGEKGGGNQGRARARARSAHGGASSGGRLWWWAMGAGAGCPPAGLAGRSSTRGPPGCGPSVIVGPPVAQAQPRQHRQGSPLKASKARPRQDGQRRVGPASGGTTPVPRQTRQLNVLKLPEPRQ